MGFVGTLGREATFRQNDFTVSGVLKKKLKEKDKKRAQRRAERRRTETSGL